MGMDKKKPAPFRLREDFISEAKAEMHA